MYAHNLRNSRPKKIQPTVQQRTTSNPSPPVSECVDATICHNLIDKLKQINNDSINSSSLPPSTELTKQDESTSQIISEKINEIRIRRSQSVDVLKKRLPPPIPEKSLTQREIPIKSLSSMQNPVTTIRRRMSQTVVSRTPQTKPPPIPPKQLKPFLRRKDQGSLK